MLRMLPAPACRQAGCRIGRLIGIVENFHSMDFNSCYTIFFSGPFKQRLLELRLLVEVGWAGLAAIRAKLVRMDLQRYGYEVITFSVTTY